jgi:arylsulfatase A-like enzyme
VHKRTAELLVAAFMVSLLALPAQGQNDDRPNVLFILVDDLGQQDVQPYNPDTFYETPNVQRLADSGMRFTDAYVSSPVCSPSRYSFMTGKYPARANVTNWFCGNFSKRYRDAAYQCAMPTSEVTMAEAFNDAGYTTFFAGKWHLGPKPKHWPENQGFDVNKGGFSAGHPSSYFSPYDNPRLEDGPEGEYLPFRLADETSQFIKKHKDKPFFAYLSFYEVHTPLQAPESMVETYEKKRNTLGLNNKKEFERIEQVWPDAGPRKIRIRQGHPTYAAMVEAMDRAVGQVLGTLRQAGVQDETIVVFTSDHGGLATSEGHPTSNRPLRAGKGWVYDGGLRVPLIVRVPGVTEEESVSRTPVINTDLYPTLLEAAGLEPRPQQHRDGTSFVPVLAGRKDVTSFDRDPLYFHYPHYSPQGGPPGGGIRIGPWKLVERYENGQVGLFNLRQDIGERRNLADQMPDRVRHMRRKLHTFHRELDANFLRPKGKYTDPWRPGYVNESPTDQDDAHN